MEQSKRASRSRTAGVKREGAPSLAESDAVGFTRVEGELAVLRTCVLTFAADIVGSTASRYNVMVRVTKHICRLHVVRVGDSKARRREAMAGLIFGL